MEQLQQVEPLALVKGDGWRNIGGAERRVALTNDLLQVLLGYLLPADV